MKFLCKFLSRYITTFAYCHSIYSLIQKMMVKGRCTAVQTLYLVHALFLYTQVKRWWGLRWLWSYGNWYLCNQCLSPLMVWVWILIRVRCSTLYDKVCQWLATGRWFTPGPPDSSTNKTDHHDITETLLKVVLNTTKQTNSKRRVYCCTNIVFGPFIILLDTSYSG
jgi:hypothetical protein